MKRYTQEQIDRANATDLVPFLQRRGEEFKREGKEYCWKKHDSVYINGNQWFRHSQGKGGRAIDFMVEFYEMTFVEAVKELIGEEPEEQNKTPSQHEETNTKEIVETSGVQDVGGRES